MGGNFILTSDVDLSSIGTKTNSIFAGDFSGTIDGNGHKIQNFKIDTGGAAVNNVGLFSQISGTGTIKNLAIEGFTVNATNSYYIGGLVGLISGGTVENCSAKGTMNTYMTSGLLVGENDGGQVLSCSSGGSLTGTGWSASGLVGWNTGGGLVSKSYSSATVINTGGEGDAGGVVGYNDGATVSECYFSGSASSLVSTYANVGGVVACNDVGVITNCYSTGDAKVSGVGSGKIGGVVGSNWAGGTVSNCYAAGTVTGTSSLISGGVVGDNSGVVDNTNFYKNNMSSDKGSSINASIAPPPTGSWNTGVWDMSNSMPVLKNSSTTLSATLQSSTKLQVGSEASSTSRVDTLSRLMLNEINFNISSQASAQATIAKIDSKMAQLNDYRSGVGSATNKLQSILQSIDNRVTNLGASKSTVNDTDMASESAKLIQNQIRNQAATTLMAQTKGLDASLLMQLIG